jgi:hypothetical protein
MTPEEKIARANLARQVLDNPAYTEAVGKFMEDVRALRLSISPRDTDGAVKLVLMEQAVEKARRLMESYLHDGEAARRELEREVLPGPIGRLNRAFRRGQAA